jgi:hypothetical protein
MLVLQLLVLLGSQGSMGVTVPGTCVGAVFSGCPGALILGQPTFTFTDCDVVGLQSGGPLWITFVPPHSVVFAPLAVGTVQYVLTLTSTPVPQTCTISVLALTTSVQNGDVSFVSTTINDLSTFNGNMK